MSVGSETNQTLKSRVAHEFRVYAAVSLYLFVCFSVLLVYQASQSVNTDATLLTLGTAAVKALIIGKFILLGEALNPGTRRAARTLLHRIVWRSLGLLFVLVIFKLLEELIVGLAHGEAIRTTIGELADASWLALLAPVLLMLLILIPLMIAIELDKALGTGGLMGLLLREE